MAPDQDPFKSFFPLVIIQKVFFFFSFQSFKFPFFKLFPETIEDMVETFSELYENITGNPLLVTESEIGRSKSLIN